jgi:hypothetical protein
MPHKGGRRRGAGRKPIPESERSIRVSVCLPPDLLAYARKCGGGLSHGVQRALRFHRTNHEKPTR